MSRFSVSYDVVTPESAEHGDIADCGSVDRYGYRHPVEADPAKRSHDDCAMTLREALQLCDPQYDCGQWFSEADGRTNYQTGAVETRALHPPHNVTASSYDRLSRLLGVRR